MSIPNLEALEKLLNQGTRYAEINGKIRDLKRVVGRGKLHSLGKKVIDGSYLYPLNIQKLPFSTVSKDFASKEAQTLGHNMQLLNHPKTSQFQSARLIPNTQFILEEADPVKKLVIPKAKERGRHLRNDGHEIWKLAPTKAVFWKQQLKNYYDSSQFRKRLREAGFSEKDIQRRKELIDTTNFHLSDDMNLHTQGTSYSDHNIIFLNDAIIPANRNIVPMHELTHSANLSRLITPTEFKKADKNFFTKEIPLQGSGQYQISSQKLQNYNASVIKDVVSKYGNLDIVRNQPEKTKKWVQYVFTPVEVQANITPLQAQANLKGWTPKHTAKLTSPGIANNLSINGNTPIGAMYSIIGEQGMQELISRILKKGGKI